MTTLTSPSIVQAAKHAALFLAALLASLPSATPAQRRAPTFYNLAQDDSSLQLIDLNSISGSGADTSVVLVDLFRGKQKFGLRSTWAVDCTSQRMTITQAAQFAPGWQGPATSVTPGNISPSSSRKAGTIYNLACDRSGDLVASRTYYSDLPVIIARFWR